MNKKRVEQIFRTLDPYVNGKLITHVFVRLWDELKAEVLKDEDQSK